MSKTKIPWADVSWNPITGCSPISEGCLNCYAARMAKRLAGRFGYPARPNQFDVTYRKWDEPKPHKWKKPCKIFVCSMGDIFHSGVHVDWIDEIFQTIYECQQHTFIILTKRPENITEKLLTYYHNGIKRHFEPESAFYKNVWIGVTAENQKRADERIPILLQIPAAVRFVSVEPMLGPVDLHFPAGANMGNQKFPDRLDLATEEERAEWFEGTARATYIARLSTVDWVIAGPETGPGARECKPEWIEDLYEQCRAAGVAFFDKRKTGWLAREFPAKRGKERGDG